MYCRMLQGEHSAILSTFIKKPFVIKISVLSIFELPLRTGFTVVMSAFLMMTEVTLHRGSNMSAHVLLNLLNELGKR